MAIVSEAGKAVPNLRDDLVPLEITGIRDINGRMAGEGNYFWFCRDERGRRGFSESFDG